MYCLQLIHSRNTLKYIIHVFTLTCYARINAFTLYPNALLALEHWYNQVNIQTIVYLFQLYYVSGKVGFLTLTTAC